MAEKKLSIAALDRLLKLEKKEPINTIKYDFDEVFEISVKNYISFAESMQLVAGVSQTIFPIGDDGETYYEPMLLEYTKALHYIEYFTNLKVEIGADRVYAMLYGCDIMRTIYKNINPAQYNAIEEAIESAIAHKLATLQIGERSKIEDAVDKIDKAGAALEAMMSQFANIDQHTMQTAIENIASITPEDFTGAVIDIRDGSARHD